MSSRLLVEPITQTASLFQWEKVVKKFRVSTSFRGLGCTEDSLCTPHGRFLISDKIGANLAPGSVLRGRIPTGEIAQNWESKDEKDLVLTRILWLDGADIHNSNTKQRHIYLHGTNQEHLLGSPASHGCVRFGNRDIIEVFDLLNIGDLVEILGSVDNWDPGALADNGQNRP